MMSLPSRALQTKEVKVFRVTVMLIPPLMNTVIGLSHTKLLSDALPVGNDGDDDNLSAL